MTPADASQPVSSQSGQAPETGRFRSFIKDANGSGGRELTLKSIDVGSAGRLGLVFAVVTFAVWVLAWMLVWLVLAVAGVWGRMNSLLADIAGFGGISGWGFLGAVVLVGLLEFLVVWALVPLSAVVYNAAAELLGGLKLRVSDRAGAAEAVTGAAGAAQSQPAAEAAVAAAPEETVGAASQNEGDKPAEEAPNTGAEQAANKATGEAGK